MFKKDLKQKNDFYNTILHCKGLNRQSIKLVSERHRSKLGSKLLSVRFHTQLNLHGSTTKNIPIGIEI